MANLKISQLAAIAEADVVSADVLAVADLSATETKKITAADLVKAGARLNAGPVTFGDDVVITGDLTVNGTSTTIESTTVVVEDKNIELGAVATPTDVTADGGGIYLQGTTPKLLLWNNTTDAWTSSEHVDLATGKSYYINGSQVLSSTTLGSGVTGSSLTSLGTVTTGTWSASTIAVNKGGTGQTSYTDGQLLIGNSTGNTLTKATLTAGTGVTITNGNGSITISAAGSGGTVTGVTGTAPIASSGGTAPDISLSLKTNGGLVTETGTLAVDLSASSITGTLGVADGGTGQTSFTDGQLLIGKTDGSLAKATLTAGTGTTITNGDGTITIAATGTGLPTTGGTLTGDLLLENQSDLRFGEATGHGGNWVAFQAPATIASNVTWTLPAADGSNGQILSTDGAGTLSWTAAGGVGDVLLAGNNAFTGANTFTNTTGQIFRPAATQDGVLIRGRAGGTSSYTAEVVPTTLTASRTITLPDATGTVALLGTAQTFTAVQTLTDPVIIGTITEDVYTISDGAAFEIDPGNGSIQLITLGANRTPKATNFAAGESVTLMVDDGSAYTLTWSDATFGGSGVVWKTNTGSAPTLNTSGYTVIVLWKVGTQVYGARVGDA